MKLIKQALSLKLLNSTVEFLWKSFESGVRRTWHNILHHRLYYIDVHSSWSMYGLLKEEALVASAKALTHYEFKGVGEKIGADYDPITAKVKHAGKYITISFYQTTPTEDEVKRGQSSQKFAKVSSYHSLGVLESYLKHLDDKFNSYEILESSIYSFLKDSRKELGHFNHADILEPVLPVGVLDDIVQDMATFIQRKEHYRARGIPWHRGYCFYGPPGTGKSSITYYLAKKFKRNIYQITASALTSSNIQEMMSRISNYSIVVVEDIDCMYHGREALDRALPSFNDLLNAFDSIVAPKGLLLIITTNHIVHLDEALIRSGRIDRKWEFTYCDNHQIAGLILRFYPEWEAPLPADYSGKFTPAQIQEMLIETNSVDEFLNKLHKEVK